jgi:hypothetical protein
MVDAGLIDANRPLDQLFFANCNRPWELSFLGNYGHRLQEIVQAVVVRKRCCFMAQWLSL